jgi:hypothetical protein
MQLDEYPNESSLGVIVTWYFHTVGIKQGANASVQRKQGAVFSLYKYVTVADCSSRGAMVQDPGNADSGEFKSKEVIFEFPVPLPGHYCHGHFVWEIPDICLVR